MGRLWLKANKVKQYWNAYYKVFQAKGIRKFPGQRGHVSYFFPIFDSQPNSADPCVKLVFSINHTMGEGLLSDHTGIWTFLSTGYTFTGIWFDGIKRAWTSYRARLCDLSISQSPQLHSGDCEHHPLVAAGIYKWSGIESKRKGAGEYNVVYFIFWPNLWN